MMTFLRKHGRKQIIFFVFLFLSLGVTNYIYSQQTGCPDDFDCDGIIDALDVDDDNDGIYDHIESPNCFYLSKEVHEAGDRREFIAVSATLPYTGTPDMLVDGITTTSTTNGVTIAGNTALTDREIVRLTSEFAGGIEYSDIMIYFNTTGFFSTSSRVLLQGSQDGNSWIDLSDVITPGTAARITFNVTKNQDSYIAYRLLGVGGFTGASARVINEITVTVGNYMPSLFPKAICTGEDIDSDGKPNHQDLDSDGDGVFDVLEAGFADEDKDGVLGVSPVTVDRFGAVTSVAGYTYTKDYYKIASMDGAKDTDNDGIIDVFDVDDDNDGIFDHIESPNCFNLDKATYERGDRRELLAISTTLPYTSGSADLWIDGLTTTASGVSISTVPVLKGQEIIKLSTPYAIGLEYSTIILNFNTTGFFNTTSRVIIQGSQDGINWTDLSESVAPGTGSAVTVSVTKNQGLYGLYRLLGDSGTATARILTEVTGTIGAYMPSLYPKTQCIGEDIDNDGIPNHQDLDSDGDGVNDVVEAGFIDGDHDGRLGMSPVTVNDFGAVTSAIGYLTPYNYYKIPTIAITTDTDGDGVWDVFDVDDDNDGIYDHEESPNCFYVNKTSYESGDRRELLDVDSNLPYSGSTDLLIDGISITTNGITIGASTSLTGKEIVRLSTKQSNGIEYSALTINFSTTTFFNAATLVVLEGSKDGINWVELTETVRPATAAAVTITATKNLNSYRMYRLVGVAGTTGAVAMINEVTGVVGYYMPSLHPKAVCEGEDIDNDGKPNHQDLDSDGDGAFDVIEVGFLDGDKDGILGVSPVIVDEFGAVSSAIGYVVPTNYYKMDSFNAGVDTDDDGIVDMFDVDDDNDGIYDHIESPSCFELYKMVYEIGDRRELLAVSTSLPYTTGSLDLLIDGNLLAASGITVQTGFAIKGHEIVRLSTKFATAGIEYSTVSLVFNTTNFFNGGSVILQGSKDGIVWIDLSEDIATGTAARLDISVTKNQGLYGAYRVMGTAGLTNSGRLITEITGTVGSYFPSLYPKLTCEGEDVDQDGIPNHQDLNADGDNCNDVLEAGFLDPDRDGILGSSPVTVDQFGKVTSAIGYITPNNFYFLDSSKNVCTGEGIPVDEDSHCIDMENITNDYGLGQSTFHSNIVRTKTGFSAFGEYTNPRGGHFATPVELTPENGYAYEGDIITATLGGAGAMTSANQFFILSTEGLYTWGSVMGTCIPRSWASTTAFQKIELPEGVAPRDVKFISASFTNFVILTKSGDVYVASGFNLNAYGAYGDGSTRNDDFWHKSNITQVTSIKVNSYGQAMALTLSGDLYTWGVNVLLGDGTGAQNLLEPTKMTLPSTIETVKMTALSYANSVTYYVLGDDKRVYSLGGNNEGQLGIGTIVSQLNWQIVKAPTGVGYLENIKFINATLHDSFSGAAGAIDESGIPYLWGNNSAGRLAGTGTRILLPRIPDRSTPGDYDVIYVELGGHVTPLIDKKLGKFGYVGHKVNGSMGDGSTGDSNVAVYDFEKTPVIDFCNIVIGTKKNLRVMVNPMNINTKPERK